MRVIDSLAVFKDAEGEIEVEHLINLTDDEAQKFERVVARASSAWTSRARRASRSAGWSAPSMPPTASTCSRTRTSGTFCRTSRTTRQRRLVLIEHHWAIPLRDAIMRAGGFRISDGFISPLDLVEIGLATAEEADSLHAIETGAGVR